MERKRLAEEKERKRREYLAELGRREDESWDRVGELVAEKKVKSYDEAVLLLRGLKDLWTSRDDVETCYQGVRAIVQNFPRLIGFRSRVEQAGLLGEVRNEPESRRSIFAKKDDPVQHLIEFDRPLKGS